MRKSTRVLQEDVGQASGPHGTADTEDVFREFGDGRREVAAGAEFPGRHVSKEGVFPGGEDLGGGRAVPAGRALNRVPPEWYVRLPTPEPTPMSPPASRVFAGVRAMYWYRWISVKILCGPKANARFARGLSPPWLRFWPPEL